ncbi:phosphatidate cytidylyltransferase [Candidatus Sumerlaeota bacterium]|nr:phosphatidate cytidylyltransferase [Candidatus Sumerlaeota bacterium]
MRAEQAGKPRNITYVGELGRKAIHLGSLVIPASAWFLDRIDTLIMLGVMLAISLTIDIERFRGGAIGRCVRTYFSFMIRPHELNARGGIFSLTGSTWMLISAIVTFAIFPKPVAVASFSMLIVCDTAAALVGRRFGRIRFGPKQKSLEGSAAFFVMGVIVAAMVPGIPLAAGITGALVATIAEALPWSLDDNFSVPVFAGITMVLLGW